jgi:hypothetical protein
LVLNQTVIDLNLNNIFNRRKKMKKNFQQFMVVAMSFVFLASTMAGCKDNASANRQANNNINNWVDTKAVNKKIDLELVRQLIDEAPEDPNVFQEAINKPNVYKGSGEVVVEIETTPDGKKKISGWEYPNNDGVRGEELFSYIPDEKGFELQGYGENSNVHQSYVYSRPIIHWWLLPMYNAPTSVTRIVVVKKPRIVNGSGSVYNDRRGRNNSTLNQSSGQSINNLDKARQEAVNNQRDLSGAMNSNFVQRDPNKDIGSGAFGQKKDGIITTPTSTSSTQQPLQAGTTATAGLQNPNKLNNALKANFEIRDVSKDIGSGAFGQIPEIKKPDIMPLVQPERKVVAYKPPPPANDSFYNAGNTNKKLTTSNRITGGSSFGKSKRRGK